jgi:hypothetical protein
MLKLFKSESLNNSFFEKGVVKIQLFNKEQIERILKYYHENVELMQKSELKESFHMTSNLSDYQRKKDINDFLTPIYEFELSKHLINYKIAFSGYFVKEASENSEVPAHFDWTFVNEEEHFSFNAWVCLEESNYKNGNMQFIIGSHKFNKTLRVTPWRPHYFNEYQNEIKDYFVDVPTKAGECLIFHHSMIHSSRKNFTNKSRISTVAVAYCADAELIYCHWDEDAPTDKVEKYSMNTDAFLKMEKNQKPNEKLFKEYMEYDIKDLSFDQFKNNAIKHISYSTIIKNRLKNKIYKLLS